MIHSPVPALSVLAAIGFSVGAASAASVEFTGSSGDLAAKATFDVTGTVLTVTLQNTASIPTPDNPALLENVFWNSSSLGNVGTTAYLFDVYTPAGSGPVAPATTSSGPRLTVCNL